MSKDGVMSGIGVVSHPFSLKERKKEKEKENHWRIAAET